MKKDEYLITGRLMAGDWRTAQTEGEMPESMFQDDSIRLLFWGTLCNRDALCGETDARTTPAELAARLFKRYGTVSFSRLDGSFTIVYYSPRACGLVRDAHGTHLPIYYRADGWFSTLLSSFIEMEKAAGPDRLSLSAFLQRGLLPQGRSAWTGVSRLEAGCRLHAEAGKLSVHTLWAMPADTSKSYDLNDLEECSQRYGELHRQAIRRRIASCGQVGILLSGGYDSGSNLAALRAVHTGQIDSYSVGFKGDAWTELPLAQIMSQEFGTRHHTYEIDGSEIQFLPDIVRTLGEPFVEGGLMVNYCAMRMIGEQKPPVILGGDGNDQYFGTASRELALYSLASRWKMLPPLQLLEKLLNRFVQETGGKLYRIRFHLDRILHLLEGDRFGFTDTVMQKLLQHPVEDFRRPVPPTPNAGSFDALYEQHTLLSDIETVINRVILYKASSMARMFGNRLAFPFMDRDIYTFLQSLPVGLKCKTENLWSTAKGHSSSKYLLKHHYKPLLPTAITERKKQGGFAPMPLFFSDPQRRERFKDFILSSSIHEDYLDRKAVHNFLQAYDADTSHTDTWFWFRQNRALQYFNLLTLVIWWEEYVKGEKVGF